MIAKLSLGQIQVQYHTPFNVFDEKGGKPDTSINIIVTDDVMFTFQSVGEIYDDDDEQDLREKIVHTRIQSDPGEYLR